MRNRSIILTSALTVIFLWFAGIAGAQDDKDKFKARYDANSENKEFNPHDFGGIWMMTRVDHGLGAPAPPLTPAGVAAMAGRVADSRSGVNGNAPWYACNPSGENLENLGPAWYGHSVAKWEGNTLVVNTVGLDERAWLDNTGLPKSFHARIEERYTRTAYNTVELQMTLYDPEYYTATYVGGKKSFKKVPDDASTYFGWKGLFAGISEGICAPMNEVEGYNKGFRDVGQAKPK